LNDGFLKELGSEKAEDETVRFNECYKELLEENQLQSLVDFMSSSTENSYRSVAERLTVGLDLKSKENGPVRVYLKRHWLDKEGSSSKPYQEAISEWDNINELASQGINVPEALAVGWGQIKNHATAFVMMKEVPGVQADHFIEKNFKGPSDPELKNFIKQLAVFAAQFHQLGYNHRDFYLCHTFVKKEADSYLFHLIDLQRVQKRKLLRRRWIVKDLAQLNYSALNLVCSEYRELFFDVYLQETGAARKLLRAVDKKTETMVKRELQGKVR
jgi:heptose I phosphotransferase